MKINPFYFDNYICGLSGGKDSAAAALWLRFESGWPTNRMIFTTNETYNEDPFTYGYLALLSEVMDMPILVIEPELGFYELARSKKRFPSPNARFCTQRLKVVPSMRFISSLNGRPLIVSGIRRAEGTVSNGRGDRLRLQYDDGYGAWAHCPVYEYDLEDVWDIARKYIPLDMVAHLIESDPDMAHDKKDILLSRLYGSGVPCNPLYLMGASRVGCFPCIMSRKREIRAMSDFRPERVAFIAEQEGSFLNINMYSTFFSLTTTPAQFRRKEIVTKKGERRMAPTIHDVVDWSRTGHGGRQYAFAFRELVDDSPLVCDYRGACE